MSFNPRLTESSMTGRKTGGITVSYTVSSVVLAFLFVWMAGGVAGAAVVEDSW
jgi:hypothetical protein